MNRKVKKISRANLPSFATAGRQFTVAQKRKCIGSNSYDRSMEDLLW